MFKRTRTGNGGRMTVPGQGQDPKSAGGQDPAGGDPKETTQQQQTGGQQPPAGQEPPAQTERFDAEYVKSLRQSEAATRKRLKELEAKQEEADRAKLSETERLQKELDDAKKEAAEATQQARQALIRSAVMVELGTQGAKNPALCYRLVDQAALNLDDDGNVTGADKAVKALLEAEPYLKGTTESNGSGGPPTTPKGGATPTKEELVKQHSEKLAGSGLFSPL